MNKILISLAVVLMSVNAMATKARLNALGNARHLLDIQSFGNNPSDLHALNDYAYIEFGNNRDSALQTGAGYLGTANAATKAEGGFMKSLGNDTKIAVYLGRRAEASAFLTSAANIHVLPEASLLPYEQNPLDLVYLNQIGGYKTAFGVHYASGSSDSYTLPKTPVAGNTTAIKGKSSSLAVYAGLRGDNHDAYIRVGLGGGAKNETAGSELKPEGFVKIGGRYAVDTITYFADATSAKAEVSGTGITTTKASQVDYQLGMVNNHKVDSGSFFYGASYSSVVQEKKDATTTKNTFTKIPLVIGMEVDAADWMVFRGSVTQSIFLNDSKVEFGKAGLAALGVANQILGKNSMAADTVVSTGVGFKWNKVMLDTTLAGSTTGTINGDSLFANTSLVYNM